MLDRKEESYTVTIYQTYKVNVSAFSDDGAAELASVQVGANPELYLASIDCEVERD
jgi:hypothetical protein